ncbi:MAG: AMP-binding protein, partial [Gammaproteobacteria bacterium]
MPETTAALQDTADRLVPAVLEIVRQTYVDLHRRQPRAPIGLSTSLDRDLELDSLARVELVVRLERSFSVRMPDTVLEAAETCGDLVRLLRSAGPAHVPAQPRPVEPVEPAAAGVPEHAGTLLEVLDWHVQRHADRLHLRHVDDPLGEDVGATLTYGALHAGARRAAAGIQARGIRAGQTVALMLPTGLDYFIAYFAVLLAGCVPVPIYPPLRRSQIEEHVRRHAGILGNAEAALMITVEDARAMAQLLSAHVPSLRGVTTVAELQQAQVRHVPAAARTDDLAFIQYTSGSTGSPKGVALTHANLLANIRAFGEAARLGGDVVIVSWLPLYHDMGLIGAWLSSLYFGTPFVVMSPLAFLAHPERWLWAIHKYRGTHTVAPNFAYELCVRRIDDADIRGLDLGSLRVAADGSEQVLPETLERFATRFERCGFDRRTLLPVYGLAECSVGLLVPPPGRGVRVDSIRRRHFMQDGRAQPAPADDPSPLRFVACGRPLPGHEVRLVDADGAPVGERIEGRLEFRGPSATRGYYRNPELTRALFHDGWLDSGDRAYTADGEYYVTGRAKDIIIRSGRNLYPDEIEDAVGAVPGVRRGCVVACGVGDPERGSERLVILAETRETDAQRRAQLHDAIVAAVAARIGEPPDDIVLAPPKAVLKTSSGKLRRAATRERYLGGTLGRTPRGARWQVVRLALSALPALVMQRLRRVPALLYGAYAWLLFALFAPVAWLLVLSAPRPQAAWRMLHGLSRSLLRSAGVGLTVEGLEHVPRDKACVIVANHASSLDGLMLLAALPCHARFVAKREFLDAPVARLFLRGLGCEFVERFAVHQSVEDARRLGAAVQAGASLI